MTYSEAIENIMPEVQEGSSKPFIIYRNKNLGWNVESTNVDREETFWGIEVNDPMATVHSGKDFSNGSYPYVYDSVLCSRVREELEYKSYREPLIGDHKEASALANFFEDNVGDFSQDVMDYMISQDRPLTALAKVCPIKLFTYDRDMTYNERHTREAIDRIEFAIYKRRQISKENPQQSKRIINGCEVKQSIKIGDKEIIFAEPNEKTGLCIVCDIKREGPLKTEKIINFLYTPYLEALREFGTRIDKTATELKDREVAAKTLALKKKNSNRPANRQTRHDKPSLATKLEAAKEMAKGAAEPKIEYKPNNKRQNRTEAR